MSPAHRVGDDVVGGRVERDRPRLAWVLNLDAEHELEVAGSYTPSARLRAIVARERRRLLGNLVAPGDVVLDGGAGADAAAGLAGICWSPTPRALARLRGAGAVPFAAPPVDVLRAANARAFAAAVRAPLAGASFAKSVASDLDRALALLARSAPDGWLVRRAFGAAGRGRRRITAGRVAPVDRAWLAASLALGPVVVEPWVAVTREHTRSGWVSPAGEVVISAPCLQQTTRAGAWIRTELAASADDVGRADDAVLEAAFEAAGRALAAAGYFGPFGIDAFRHRAPGSAREVLNPLSEINARFTMDWATALGPDAARANERLAELLGRASLGEARA
jgi:hypothetical protein